MATIILEVKMTEKQRRYKFGYFILRERKDRYYVYKLEYEGGNVKERYIGPLTDVVETYEKLKKEEWGSGIPPSGPAGI
ncbi:putative integrase [Sulfuracidifex tepidarius]|uniref:putative integrase n=1 Tax=Sulfuracidifex tepidarius TaxID=1294262 RepID=UPI001E3189D1|nr:putative integrase [Sulfuracidifex tepidarius]